MSQFQDLIFNAVNNYNLNSTVIDELGYGAKVVKSDDENRYLLLVAKRLDNPGGMHSAFVDVVDKNCIRQVGSLVTGINANGVSVDIYINKPFGETNDLVLYPNDNYAIFVNSVDYDSDEVIDVNTLLETRASLYHQSFLFVWMLIDDEITEPEEPNKGEFEIETLTITSVNGQVISEISDKKVYKC